MRRRFLLVLPNKLFRTRSKMKDHLLCWLLDSVFFVTSKGAFYCYGPVKWTSIEIIKQCMQFFLNITWTHSDKMFKCPLFGFSPLSYMEQVYVTLRFYACICTICASIFDRKNTSNLSTWESEEKKLTAVVYMSLFVCL